MALRGLPGAGGSFRRPPPGFARDGSLSKVETMRHRETGWRPESLPHPQLVDLRLAVGVEREVADSL
jgi:hypothetical protein